MRAADDAEADSRLRAVAGARAGARDAAAPSAVAGDLTAPRLGLGERHEPLAARVGSVIHSAASVAFDLPLEEARAINVEGTRRVLDFAGAVPGLQRVTYVSTAYVAGDRRGTAYEDDRETGAFRNAYERSKHEAEALVRSSDAAVDDRAAEHRRRREHHRLDGVVQRPLRAAARLRRRRLPGAARAPALAGRRGAGRLRRRRGRRARARIPRRRAGPST